MGHKSTEKYNDICALKHNMLHYVMGETEKGFEDDPTKVHVLKEYIGMIKDLAEAEKACQEACYYESVVEAMENSDMGYDRMGYTPRRTKTGRYKSQPDRSRIDRMDDGDMDGRRGYDPYGGPYTRMMFGDDRDEWDDEDEQYGKSYNRFRKAKRHYTKTHSEADKQKRLENQYVRSGAYKKAMMAYDKWEGTVMDMKINPEKYSHLSGEQFRREVRKAQDEMKRIREEMARFGRKHRVSEYETWRP